MKEQMKRIMTILSERLDKYGFKKKGYNYFVRMADEKTIQNIGFSIATHGEKHAFYLSPSPGIVYKDVSELEMQLRNLGVSKYPDYVGAMLCSPIGYLMPARDYIEWKFMLSEDNIAEEVNAMADAIIEYGIPYMEKLVDRDEVVYGMEIGKYGGAREFVLPILHYLRGNSPRALECINEFIKKFSATSHLEDYEADVLKRLLGENDRLYEINNNGLKSYLDFADNFKQMMNCHDR